MIKMFLMRFMPCVLRFMLCLFTQMLRLRVYSLPAVTGVACRYWHRSLLFVIYRVRQPVLLFAVRLVPVIARALRLRKDLLIPQYPGMPLVSYWVEYLS